MLIPTHELTQASIAQLPSLVRDQVYNSLDCCVTFEVHEALQVLTSSESTIYRFERALQAPVLEMMLRGFKVDPLERSTAVAETRVELERLNSILQQYAYAIWGKPLNPRSTLQLQAFFYGRMGLPQVYSFSKGKRVLSMNRETLEKLEAYFLAMPIVAVILEYRDRAKRLEVLETQIDPDGRYRTSFNIAGTETGRFSSSKSQTGTGGNAQNISPKQRKMFEADQGFRLFGIDLEQAESREVGWNCGVLFGEWAYYDAAIAGDLHTTAAKLVWPNLKWIGEPKADKEIAEKPFYRHFSYRDMAKRGGHGCLTVDHEVLTEKGWVSITEKPKRIMTFHPRLGSWLDTVSHWADFEYSGMLVEVDEQAISFKATADHRILGTTSALGEGYTVYSAGRLPKTVKIPKGWGYRKDTDEGPSPEMARFLAAFHSDGSIKSTNRCEFHLHKQRKVDALRILCKNLHLPLEENWGKRTYTISICLGKLKEDSWPGFHWSSAAIHAYITEYPKWDGHESETALRIFSTRLDFLELFQTFARLIGKGGNISKPSISGFGSKVWALQINNRKFAVVPKVKRTQETVRVLCPTVPNSFFYIRRKGRISVTGNSNYYGQSFTMARHLKVEKKIMEDFQGAYFQAFPGIPKWHRWVATEIQTRGSLTTKFGRERHFFGRTSEDTTLREAIAYDPQSCTADRTNLILWRLWRYMGKKIQLLTQEHDAIYFQASMDHDPEEIAKEALAHFSIPFSHPTGRTLIVPGECKIGWNKANYVGEADVEWARTNNRPLSLPNPNGLRKLKGPDSRVRQSGLARTL